MRLSVDSSDPGYPRWLALQSQDCKVRVFLDDAEVCDVVACDEERGQIVCYRKDSSGELVIDRIAREIATETLTGRVRIEVESAKGTVH